MSFCIAGVTCPLGFFGSAEVIGVGFHSWAKGEAVKQVAIGAWGLRDFRIKGKWVHGLFQEFFSATDFFGGGDVVRNAEFFEGGGVIDVLRAVAPDATPEFGMAGTGKSFSAGTFVSPGTIGFRAVFGARDVSAPAADGVVFKCRVKSAEFRVLNGWFARGGVLKRRQGR